MAVWVPCVACARGTACAAELIPHGRCAAAWTPSMGRAGWHGMCCCMGATHGWCKGHGLRC
eukprot:351251-Chlamydomonas_euryale.AAC.8